MKLVRGSISCNVSIVCADCDVGEGGEGGAGIYDLEWLSFSPTNAVSQLHILNPSSPCYQLHHFPTCVSKRAAGV